MRRPALAALLVAAVIGGAGGAVAAPATAPTPGDPWEKFNRIGFAIQGAIDRVFIRPAALLFHSLTPGPLGQAVHNLVVNLSEPTAFINDMLQGRVKRAGIPAGRFLANSTIGILGLIDVAGHWGLPHHDNEFGITLGRWGAGPGPYVFVPLVGPSTVRDLIGKGVDLATDPIHFASYANRTEVSTIRVIVGGLDTRIMNDADLQALMASAADPYATLRSVYLQNRQGEIEGEGAGVPVQSLPSFDEPAPPPAPATAGATPVEEPPAATPPATAPTPVQPPVQPQP
jgi:phospholipid-binding lipoprotein MlaA